LWTDGRGAPLGLAVAGANRNDFKLVGQTLESWPEGSPAPPDGQEQGMCQDKGYDYDEVYAVLREYGYTPHIRPRDEEASLIERDPSFTPRRWAVERTHPRMNRFRRILIR